MCKYKGSYLCNENAEGLTLNRDTNAEKEKMFGFCLCYMESWLCLFVRTWYLDTDEGKSMAAKLFFLVLKSWQNWGVLVSDSSKWSTLSDSSKYLCPVEHSIQVHVTQVIVM